MQLFGQNLQSKRCPCVDPLYWSGQSLACMHRMQWVRWQSARCPATLRPSNQKSTTFRRQKFKQNCIERAHAVLAERQSTPSCIDRLLLLRTGCRHRLPHHHQNHCLPGHHHHHVPADLGTWHTHTHATCLHWLPALAALYQTHHGTKGSTVAQRKGIKLTIKRSRVPFPVTV